MGFAAETGDPLPEAARKLVAKGLDLIVANDVSRADSGFAVDTNRVTLLAPGRDPEAWPLLSKREVATRLERNVHGDSSGVRGAAMLVPT